MSRFTLPRDIYHGKGSLSELKNLKGKKAILVVGGGSMKRQGFLDMAVNYLKEAGMEVRLFEGVEPDPSVETVMKGAQTMREFEPDWIVSMGGGSPIDAAKAMWAFYEYPDVTFEDLCIPFNFPQLRTKAKLAAIPSTSGTATEVTAFSVITDYAKGVKYPLADFNITPDIAIVDPDLVKGLPAKQVAYTGMDALTHAIEAYVSTLHGPFTDPLALQAIEMVLDYLPASYHGNMDAREQIHGVGAAVGNMAGGECRAGLMGHGVNDAKKSIGECHSCQTLCIVHLLSCVHTHVVGCRQVVQDHFDGLKSQGICERTMQGRYISLNGMGQGIHSGVSYLLYRKAGYKIRIYDSNVRSNIKIRQWVFYTCMIIGNNGESSYFCCSSGSHI